MSPYAIEFGESPLGPNATSTRVSGQPRVTATIGTNPLSCVIDRLWTKISALSGS